MKQSFFSHGKLLLTGEYLVLDGAKSLAIPTQKGQEMMVEMLPGSGNIHWTAKDLNGNIWLNFSFILTESELIPITVGNLYPQTDVLIVKRILENALILNPYFLIQQSDYEITTHLQFSADWGLGSSSTLIANIAKWAEVDAMKLFFNSFEGSGYDVALAMEEQPIVYHLFNKNAYWDLINFNPPFAGELFFIHLGKKQSSRNEIVKYKNKAKPTSLQIELISGITQQILECKNLDLFEGLINQHELIIAEILQNTTIKNRLFTDYPGAIKSLGAWGGDFILATRNDAVKYFKSKGYKNIIGWYDLIKKA